MNKASLTNLSTYTEEIKKNFSVKGHTHSIYATKDEVANAGKVKAVNNIEPDAEGNIAISTDDGDIDTSLINNLFTGDPILEEIDFTTDDGDVSNDLITGLFANDPSNSEDYNPVLMKIVTQAEYNSLTPVTGVMYVIPE